MFKVGDRVKMIATKYTDQEDCPRWGGKFGHIPAVISEMKETNNVYSFKLNFDNGKYNSWFNSNDLELINSHMSLKQKFQDLFLQEPEKSFRKAGITNESGMLTSEGQDIFLTWLLKNNGASFKTEVVDPILAEEKKA
jgi:hypothetical protein